MSSMRRFDKMLLTFRRFGLTMGAMTMTSKPKRTSPLLRAWVIGLIGAVLLIALAVGGIRLSQAIAPKEGKDFLLQQGTCSAAGTVGAQMDLTVTNASEYGIRVKVTLEYRGADGQLIDTDTSEIKAPAGDTVLRREVTLMPNVEAVRSCPIVDVVATWD